MSEARETVTASEFKTNFGKYADQVIQTKQPIDITRNGKVVLTLSPSDTDANVTKLMAMKGILKGNTMTIEEARDERLARQ